MDLEKIISTLKLQLPSPCESINIGTSTKELMIKRDDLIHPIISGNKWRKLQFHLQEFYASGKKTIASLGGVYSNHLHALAYCCNALKIPCHLLIYGNHTGSLTPTLLDAQNWNAHCISISRENAQSLRIKPELCEDLVTSEMYWIPEGGGGEHGVRGIQSIIDELPENFDKPDHLVLCACGTGTTITGLLRYSKNFELKSLKVVRSARYSFDENPRFKWIDGKGLKAFAQSSVQQLEYYKQFQMKYGMELDKVYTGPLIFSYLNDPEHSEFSKILLIHSGGLQGNRLME